MNRLIEPVHKNSENVSLDDTLREFQAYLAKRNLSGSTIVSYLFGVRSFFRHYPELTPDRPGSWNITSLRPSIPASVP